MQPARQETHTQTNTTARETGKALSQSSLEAHHLPSPSLDQ